MDTYRIQPYHSVPAFLVYHKTGLAGLEQIGCLETSLLEISYLETPLFKCILSISVDLPWSLKTDQGHPKGKEARPSQPRKPSLSPEPGAPESLCLQDPSGWASFAKVIRSASIWEHGWGWRGRKNSSPFSGCFPLLSRALRGLCGWGAMAWNPVPGLVPEAPNNRFASEAPGWKLALTLPNPAGTHSLCSQFQK